MQPPFLFGKLVKKQNENVTNLVLIFAREKTFSVYPSFCICLKLVKIKQKSCVIGSIKTKYLLSAFEIFVIDGTLAAST